MPGRIALLFVCIIHVCPCLRFLSHCFLLQVANGSMIADIPMLMDMLTGDDSAELESLRLVRAGRAAKAGARAGRIFRLIRVIRLVRVFKLLKLASKLRKQREQGDRSGGKDVQAAQNRQNLSNVGLRMMEAIAMPIKLLQSNFVQRRRCISQSRVPGVPCASVVGTASHGVDAQLHALARKSS